VRAPGHQGRGDTAARVVCESGERTQLPSQRRAGAVCRNRAPRAATQRQRCDARGGGAASARNPRAAGARVFASVAATSGSEACGSSDDDGSVSRAAAAAAATAAAQTLRSAQVRARQRAAMHSMQPAAAADPRRARGWLQRAGWQLRREERASGHQRRVHTARVDKLERSGGSTAAAATASSTLTAAACREMRKHPLETKCDRALRSSHGSTQARSQ